MGARETALSALIACRKDGAWANGVLKEYILRDRLDSRDSALATRLVYGVIQNRGLLDFYLRQLLTGKLENLHPVVRDILHMGLYQLYQMDKNLFEAAQDLGCTWMQAFWKVIVPEIRPGIVNGIITAFTMSIDDFVISYFAAGSGAQTLSMVIYSMTRMRISPEINALSTLLFVTVLALMSIINLRESHQEKAMLRAKRQLGR